MHGALTSKRFPPIIDELSCWSSEGRRLEHGGKATGLHRVHSKLLSIGSDLIEMTTTEDAGLLLLMLSAADDADVIDHDVTDEYDEVFERTVPTVTRQLQSTLRLVRA